MKNIILLILLSVTINFADTQKENATEETYFQYLTEAVESVEEARKDALVALNNMVKKVDTAKESNPQIEDSITTKIVETHAIGQIAKSTADVEIAKTKAIASISLAIDNIDNATEEKRQKVEDASLAVIVQAIASVEIAKANASQNIVEATKRVEISKTKTGRAIVHEKETLSIAKNISAVQIAQSVSHVEVAKANSLIDIARSSIQNIKSPLSKEEEKKLKDIKAQATAKISSYLTKLELLKAELTTKIAEEIVKVELLEHTMMTSSDN